jgi:hypothetical protein
VNGAPASGHEALAATKLNLKEALVWIDRELNGYVDLKVKDLPPYRRRISIPEGYNQS